MSDIHGNRRKPVTGALIVILIAAAVLAGCGGSSNGSSTSTHAGKGPTAARGGARVAASTAALKRYTNFAACMRRHGIKLPAPDASGKGQIFDTRGIDTTSRAFRVADAKCLGELRPAGASAADTAAPPSRQ